MFFTSRNQRLGDLAAGTVVVMEQEGQAAAAALPSRAGVRFGAARMTPAEIEVLQHFLRRRDELPEATRLNSAAQLAARIRERLNVPVTAGGSDEELIEAVAAEYRRA